MSDPMISTIEIENNLIADTMDKFDQIDRANTDCGNNDRGNTDRGNTDRGNIDSDNTPSANLSASRQFAASLKLINDEYTYGHEKKQQTGPVVVGFDSEQFIKYSDKSSPYYDPNITDFNEISRELFRTEECGLVGTSSSRPWRPLPSIMDLQFALRKRPLCATGTARTRHLVHM